MKTFWAAWDWFYIALMLFAGITGIIVGDWQRLLAYCAGIGFTCAIISRIRSASR